MNSGRVVFANPVNGVEDQPKMIARRTIGGVAYGVLFDNADSPSNNVPTRIPCVQVVAAGGAEGGLGVMMTV